MQNYGAVMPPAAAHKMVKDINPGIASSGVHDITVSGGKIFFSADDGIHGQEIWVSDGTDAGTFMLQGYKPISAVAARRI